jgi:hypothetical protein
MPTDFDWIFKRDPYWRERPKKEPLAIPATKPPTRARRVPSEPGVPSPPTEPA